MGFDLVQEINDVIFNFSRFNFSFHLVEDVFQSANSLHDLSEANVFLRLEFVCKISKMLTNGRDEFLNGMFDGRLKNIIEKVIKNVVTSNTIFQFSQFGHDFFQKLNKKTFSSFNASLSISFSLGNQFINGCLDLFKGGFHNGLSLSNFSINGSSDLSKEANNIVFHFSRFNLVFDFIESVFDLLDNFHNVTESHVFSRFKLINKITKMFANGWDKVFNGMFQGWFKNIMQQVIKNVVSCKVVLQFSQFSHDLLQKLGEKTLTLFNTSLSLGFDILNGGLDLLKGGFDNRLGSLNSGINSSLPH